MAVFAFVFCAGMAAGWLVRGIIEERSGRSRLGSCFLHYRIEEATLEVRAPGRAGELFRDVLSGDGQLESIGVKNEGPIPPGVYLVYTRDGGRPTFKGRPAFLLDPIDSCPCNDRIDDLPPDLGGGRSAFRIHAGTGTEGCLAMPEIEALARLLLPYASRESRDIYSRPPDSGRPGIQRFRQPSPGVWEPDGQGEWEVFAGERRIGLLWATP